MAGGRYLCSNCESDIVTEKVVRIESERRWVLERGGVARRQRTGFVLITHHCSCSAGPLTSRRRASYSGFVALFGRGVRLPYASPFAVIDLRDDDPLLRRWRWEVAQVTGVDEFVFWVDAERRKPLDDSRRRRRGDREDTA